MGRPLPEAITFIEKHQQVLQQKPFSVFVDFAHTPNALANALKTCRAMLEPGKRLIAVFGSAGLRDREKRRLHIRADFPRGAQAILNRR